MDEMIKALCEQIAQLPLGERVEALNKVRMALHEVSPFKDQPVDCVLWKQADDVAPNAYNPNHVAQPEMKLLRHSIEADGYTQPIVGHVKGDTVEVVDGFHRSRVGKEISSVRKKLHGYLPVTLIQDHGDKERMASTIRHNRARGVHGVAPMAEIIATMTVNGWTSGEIAEELGMEPDEILRFKHQKGIAALFEKHQFSKAWE